MARPLFAHRTTQQRFDCIVICTVAQQRPHVVFVGGKQTGAKLPVGGEPHPIAIAAERLGNRWYHTHGALAVEIPPAICRCSTTTGNLLECKHLVNSRHDLVLADHCVVQPATLGIKRHELNKSHFNVFFTTKRGKGNNFVVVHPALHDGIHLYRRHAHCNCSIDAFEHRGEFVTLGDLLEFFAVQRVEAHVDAPQTGTLQVGGHQRERGAIGGDRHVDGLTRQRRISGGGHGEHGES